MKGQFVQLNPRAKFGSAIPTSNHQLRHSSAMTKISYFNINLSIRYRELFEKCVAPLFRIPNRNTPFSGLNPAHRLPQKLNPSEIRHVFASEIVSN